MQQQTLYSYNFLLAELKLVKTIETHLVKN